MRELSKRYAAVIEPDLSQGTPSSGSAIIAVRPTSVAQLLNGDWRNNPSAARRKLGGRRPIARAYWNSGSARALGSRHAEPCMPRRPRIDGRNFPAPAAESGSRKVVHDFFAVVRPGHRNSGAQIRRLHRHLLMQSRLSRAGCAGGCCPARRPRSKDGAARRRARPCRWHHGLARRQRVAGLSPGGSRYSRRNRRHLRSRHGRRRVPAAPSAKASPPVFVTLVTLLRP